MPLDSEGVELVVRLSRGGGVSGQVIQKGWSYPNGAGLRVHEVIQREWS